MPDPTSNRGYERPDQGAEDWNQPLNDNFTTIDGDIATAQQRLDDLENRIADLENSGSYFNGTRYSLSEFADWHDWIDAASPANGDILVVDESRSGLSGEKTIPAKTKLTCDGTSNIYTLTKADSSGTANLLRPHNDNVMIDGKLDSDGNPRLVLDGNKANNTSRGGGLIGSTYWPSVSHVRILNTKIQNASGNGIQVDGKNATGITIDDILIKNNVFEGNYRHDIIAGSHSAKDGTVDENSKLTNILILNNTSTFTGAEISMTTFGEDGEDNEDPADDWHNHSHAIIGNTITVGDETSSNGSAIAFEELVREAVAYANSVDVNGQGIRGITVSKDVDEAVIFENEAKNANEASTSFTKSSYFEAGGSPRHCVWANNYFHDSDEGVFLNRCRGDMTVCENKMDNNSIDVRENNDNTGSNYELAENGSGQSGGVPDGLSNSLSYTSPKGVTVSVSWREGKVDPTKTDGTVNVSVTIDT